MFWKATDRASALERSIVQIGLKTTEIRVTNANRCCTLDAGAETRCAARCTCASSRATRLIASNFEECRVTVSGRGDISESVLGNLSLVCEDTTCEREREKRASIRTESRCGHARASDNIGGNDARSDDIGKREKTEKETPLIVWKPREILRREVGPSVARVSARGLPPATVSIRVSFSTRNYGTFQAPDLDFGQLNRLARSVSL